MDPFEELIQYALSGLSNGAIYALIGYGFATIYSSTGIINFAQGEFVMLGGMLMMFLLTVANVPFLPAVVLAILFPRLSGSPLNGLPSGRLETPRR